MNASPDAAKKASRAQMSLGERVRAGGAFVLGGYGASQILRLLSNLVLTRLIVPEAFGLMAVAVSINIWAIMLTDIGIASSVIRSPNSDDPKFLRTAWTIQIMRNSLIWLLIVSAAVAIHLLASGGAFKADSIYADPILPLVMAGTGAQLLISAFNSVNNLFAQRKLAMGKVVSVELSVQIFMTAVTITFAFLGYGVWALVIGMLSGAVLNAVMSYVVFEGPAMRLCFERRYALEIFHFGKWLVVASFFGFLLNRGDQILFGGLMDGERFGQYAVASMWLVAGATVMETIMSRVFYPAFSEILRDRPHDITKAYRKTRLLIDAVAATLAFGAFFLAEFVFSVIYPDNYAGVGYFLTILSPFLLMASFKLINTVVLAAGESRKFTSVTVLAGSAMLVVVPVVYAHVGEKAAIVSFALIEMLSLPIIWRNGARHIKLDMLTEARALGAI
ncbi:MAG: oligosaccharide flippase family protein, partial [Hyphococcus sp.]